MVGSASEIQELRAKPRGREPDPKGDVAWQVHPDLPADRPIPTWKRFLDIGCIALSLPILLPVMGMLALLVKTVSPGPILFRQERVGYLGRRFKCLKFRTMSHNADTSVHQTYVQQLIGAEVPMIKADETGDPRIIPMGKLLRATGLDELPQLINVLSGDMSLVGPRPCLPYEYEAYQPWHRERCRTLPGLTGLWQVSGKNKTTFTQMIRLDIDYVRNRSLGLDLRILLKTIPAILRQVLEGWARRRAARRSRGIPVQFQRPQPHRETGCVPGR